MNTSIKQVKITPTMNGESLPTNIIIPSEWSNLEDIKTSTITEILESDASGTESVYTLLYTPIKCQVFLVFINGLLQRENIDFTLVKNQLIFSHNVLTHSTIITTYSYLDECEGIQL